MPNGDPIKWAKEFPELEKFFAKISGALEDFARRRNLAIVKYYHEGRDWTFRFRHPRGGLGQVFVVKLGDDELGIGGAWDRPEYETATSWSKNTSTEKCKVDGENLAALLDHTFTQVVSWRDEELVPFKSKYHKWKKHFTKEQFEHRDDEYPIPRTD